MNCKKGIGFFLALMILVSNVGFAFTMHYCGGKVASFSVRTIDSSATVKKSCCAKKVIEKEGWEYSPHNSICLVLDDGSIIYPSQDEEGNGPGCFFAMDKEMDTAFYIFPNE